MKKDKNKMENKIKITISNREIFKEYFTRFNDEHYASIYHKELSLKSNPDTTLRRRIIGSVVTYFEKKAIERLLKYTEGNSIIDIPCGSGKLNSILKTTNNYIVSADASLHMIKYAKNDKFTNFEFILTDIRFLPIKNESIDIVISNRFLHRIPYENHELVINELFRISKKNAILYFSSKTILTSLIIALEELFNIGNRGDIYYLENDKIFEEIEVNSWRCTKKIRIIPFFSTGVVFLMVKGK